MEKEHRIMILLLPFAWKKLERLRHIELRRGNLNSGVECESMHCFWNITWQYVKLGVKLDVPLIQQPHIWGSVLETAGPSV